MTAMFTGAEQVTAFRTDIVVHAEEICEEKRKGNSLAHVVGIIMSVYSACFGRCCSRVSLVRCLRHARRCRSTLSHYLESPGSQTSKDTEESTDHSPFTEDPASDGDETNSSTDDGLGVMKKTRKRSLCLPTVSLPPELQNALELVLSSKSQ